ncbi:hypothetical protein HJC23_010254 [Cyclotella cryptica]|uniref:Acyltransferase n=1 Tax=Cyclotella cryptica TaxID=29204 RepID=A0ABD3Q0T1_9STRA|eukprot:CCRYP_009856-RA/>CCRYP_009856-RA protein AED:0.13 eAED:0.13 QI:0/-1/0/1/-1/1/1/0/554
MRCIGFAKKFISRTTHINSPLHQRRYLSSDFHKPSRIFLSTHVTEKFSVPLTLADVYLRDEQLPFAYAFRDTLDCESLISSWKEVLRRYPILGATADFSPGKVPTLECNVHDTVPMSFGESDLTLDQWLLQERSGQMQHVGWQSGGGAPTLSPLFDDLISAKWDAVENEGLESTCIDRKEHIATVRVTYFKGAGTAIGININHMLGDANSCFRICQVWGRAMRGLNHPMGASNDRAGATLTGMISPEMALLLNLDRDDKTSTVDGHSKFISFFETISSHWDEFIGTGTTNCTNEYESNSSERDHEYVRLEFSEELLQAMKSFGVIHCSLEKSHDSDDGAFVSTNDMITAMGWLIKRHISRKPEWNLSMVVNLRNRGGIDGFGCLEDSSIGIGLFGNALTSVIAKLPPSSSEDISLAQIWNAAVSIREALTNKMAKLEDLQILSRSGNAANSSYQGECFSSTSWMQFPLSHISFNDHPQSEGLHGFYGRPSFPLPLGDTYSSINVPCQRGGCTYKLLAPSRQVQSILALHRSISTDFLEWNRQRIANETSRFDSV